MWLLSGNSGRKCIYLRRWSSFDGHQVDFDELMARQRIYLERRKRALDAWLMETEKEEPPTMSTERPSRPKMPQRPRRAD